MSFGNPLIDVACPECGEVYHLRADSLGKRVQCQNKLCRQSFVVEPPAAGPAADLPPPSGDSHTEAGGFELPLAQTIAPPPDAFPAEPPLVRAQTASPLPEQHPATAETVAGPIEEAFAPPPVEKTVAAPAPPAAPTEKTYLRKKRRPRWLLAAEIAGAAAIVLLAIVVSVQQWRAAAEAPETRWKELQTTYQEHKWRRAKQALEEYARDFPDSPHVADVPFFADMCDAGEAIFSQTGDAAQGLAALQKIFRAHRDSPAYRDYAADLYQAASRLVDRFVERAERSAKSADAARAREADKDLDRARQSHELLATVGESMSDAWVPETTRQLADKIAAAAKETAGRMTRLEVLSLCEQLQGAGASLDFESLNRRIDALLAAAPALAKDAEIAKARTAARRAEASRVKFIPQAEAAAAKPAAPAETDQQTAAVVWQPADPSTASGAASGEVIASLARGVLYVFDASGKLLWHRRLGIDAYEPPLRLAAAAALPETLIAIDSEARALVALEAATGRELWSFRTGGDISAPLTVVEMPNGKNEPPLRRGLLPTADGDVHVIELARGEPLGRIKLGRAVTAGGVYDPHSGLAFFAADSDVVFALDPAAVDAPRRPACRSLLRTGHASGSLRAAPLVVGQYLVLSESSELERTKLRAFEIGSEGFADPEAKPLAELSTSGWSWFPPLADPERIVLAGDQGAVGLFGLNLDNRDEAIYRLIEDGSAANSESAATESRALAVHAEGDLLWIMSGGELRKLALDWFGQTLRPQWPDDATPSPVAGIPVHRAQASAAADRLSLFLTTMSPDGRRFHTTAADGRGGALLWRRQLGVEPVGDPIAKDSGVEVVDAGGEVVVVGDSSLGDGKRGFALQPAIGDELPPACEGQELMRLADATGKAFLAATSRDGRTLAIRPLAPGERWRTLPLVASLQGRPAVMGQFLVVPCSDGRLYRLRLDGGGNDAANEQPFRWSRESDPGPETAEIYPLTADAVLVCDGARRLRRLQFASRDQVSQWTIVGEAFESPRPLTGDCLITRDRIYEADASGELHALDAFNPGRRWRTWSLGGRPTSRFVVDRGRLFAVIDERRVACVDLNEQNEADGPRWITKPFAGRIAGAPAASGDILLIADGSRRVSGIGRDDGEPAWQMELACGVGPAAGAAPLGRDKLLVPLADGTLLIAPIPKQAEALAEAPQ